MKFRTRLVLAFGLAALVPLAILGLGVRQEMTRRLNRQAATRVGAEVDLLKANLARLNRATRTRLHGFAGELAGSNQFRLAELAGDDAARRWLLDWAMNAMHSRQFDMLQVQDSSGRIVSSGQFRNQFDRVDLRTPRQLAVAGELGALVDAATPEGTVRVLAAGDSFQVAGRRYTIGGGPRFALNDLIDSVDPEVTVELVLGRPPDSTLQAVLARIALPYLGPGDSTVSDSATILVTRRPDPMLALRKSVDRWFLAVLAVMVSLSMGLAFWLASRVSQPLLELAAKTETLDLDRLDQDFGTDRGDEIGTLSRLLDAMTKRLRGSAARIREAERRAATGDLARQVNHDVKNGLTPIRHVLRHLHQVAEQDPTNLVNVYRERQGTLESSVEYLAKLAQHYARLSPALDCSTVDANALLADIGLGLKSESATIETDLDPGVPPVRADAVVLRRIIENLGRNAIDALDGKPGTVRLVSGLAAGDPPRTRLSVEDTGRGMNADELNRAFDDFYTSKSTGTGLGLSVVRRLVADLGGTLRVETEPGKGSRFIVELPV